MKRSVRSTLISLLLILTAVTVRTATYEEGRGAARGIAFYPGVTRLGPNDNMVRVVGGSWLEGPQQPLERMHCDCRNSAEDVSGGGCASGVRTQNIIIENGRCERGVVYVKYLVNLFSVYMPAGVSGGMSGVEASGYVVKRSVSIQVEQRRTLFSQSWIGFVCRFGSSTYSA